MVSRRRQTLGNLTHLHHSTPPRISTTARNSTTGAQALPPCPPRTSTIHPWTIPDTNGGQIESSTQGQQEERLGIEEFRKVGEQEQMGHRQLQRLKTMVRNATWGLTESANAL